MSLCTNTSLAEWESLTADSWECWPALVHTSLNQQPITICLQHGFFNQCVLLIIDLAFHLCRQIMGGLYNAHCFSVNLFNVYK